MGPYTIYQELRKYLAFPGALYHFWDRAHRGRLTATSILNIGITICYTTRIAGDFLFRALRSTV